MLGTGILDAAEKAADDNIQSVRMQQGVLLGTIDNESVALTNEVKFPKEIVIATNGVFKVAGGKERRLAEGQVLSRDAQLASPDGSIVPVEDHVTSRAGRVILVRDGEASPLTAPVQLKNGTRVHPDGRIISPRNTLSRLLDGQIIRLSDSAVESTDTAHLEKGKVVLYKDGGRIELGPNQVMVMSDGSRVDGRGTVVRPDGSRVTLKDGEPYKFPGAGDKR